MMAAKIIAARKQLGLSRSQFAVLVGVSYRTVQSWELGLREPLGATMLRIMELQVKQ